MTWLEEDRISKIILNLIPTRGWRKGRSRWQIEIKIAMNRRNLSKDV